jgi:DNA-directed RNA polymerase subunit beta
MNRRLRAAGELIENQFRVGISRIEKTIIDKLSSAEVETVMPQNLINSKPLISAIMDFFATSQLSQFMDQTNPLSEIGHKRRISALGPGGLTRDRAGFEVRDVHPTHYGRICPLESPDGGNIGLINSMALYAKVNKYGFIETPYRKVIDCRVSDEVVYLSAIEEAGFAVAQSNVKTDEDGRIVEELVPCRKDGETIMLPPEEINFIDVSPKQLISVAANLVPFIENDDSKRATMGSNMMKQAVPVLRNDAPLVGTGMEKIVGLNSTTVLSSDVNGVVKYVDASNIVIEELSNSEGLSKIYTYKLDKNSRTNNSTFINQKPNVTIGQVVKKGQVIADSQNVIGGELALGRNVLVAFSTWDGYNYEDSILVSERLVRDDTFTSLRLEEFEIDAKDTRIGPEEITRDIPNVSDDLLKNLDETGVIYVGAHVKTGDILVSVEGIKVYSSKDIAKILNDGKYSKVNVVIDRDGEIINETIDVI